MNLEKTQTPSAAAQLRSRAELAAEILGRRAGESRRMITTAESLTGGLVSELITSVPGSSGWFDRGFVTYQVAAKIEMIDVPAETIEAAGVVSEPVAESMARGALASSLADLAVALTGVAGPSGGTATTPVGTVAIGWAERTPEGAVVTSVRTIHAPGGRREVRLAAALTALQGLIALIDGADPMRMPCEFD